MPGGSVGVANLYKKRFLENSEIIKKNYLGLLSGQCFSEGVAWGSSSRIPCCIDGPIMIGDRSPTLPIGVTKVPSTFQQRMQGLDEAIHIKHKSYCAPSPHRFLATGWF